MRARGELPAVIALGSNLGDRAATLQAAIADLAATPGIHVEAASPFVETPALTPHGIDPDKPAYLNAVVLARTTLAPAELLAALHAIERDHGRVRAERWGDRTLDLDLIAMGALTVDADGLVLPHPRAAERAFVLAPWLAVDADAELVGFGRVDALLAATGEHPTPFPTEVPS